jgi:hypothetical protein
MKQGGTVYVILLIVTILLTLAAILTLIPMASASQVSLLGYRSLCSFAPISSLLLLAAAAGVCFVRSKYFAR